MKNLIIAALLMSILFIGCKPAEQETRYFTPGFKEYFDYQPGSYWIMEDQLTGESDSFYVSSRSYDPGEKPINNDGDKWEAITTMISQAGKPGNYWSLYLYLQIATLRTKNAQYLGLLTRSFPILSKDTIGGYDAIYSLKYFGNKSIISGNADSTYMAYEIDVDDHRYNDTVFFNRQNGFVEFDQHNGSENHRWLLMRSHIIH